MTLKKFLAVNLVVFLVPSAWATGGHYPVDDAAITEPDHFQIETWFSRMDGGESDLALQAAWTPSGTSVELTAGFHRLHEDDERFMRFEPAAKWLLRATESGRVGVAASLTLGYSDNEWSDWQLNLPISYELSDVPLVLHADTGWIRDRDAGTDRLFLGGAVEWDATARFDLIGQVYREGADEDPQAQLGLRLDMADWLDHFDLAMGRDLRGSAEWFVTMGVTRTF